MRLCLCMEMGLTRKGGTITKESDLGAEDLTKQMGNIGGIRMIRLFQVLQLALFLD